LIKGIEVMSILIALTKYQGKQKFNTGRKRKNVSIQNICDITIFHENMKGKVRPKSIIIQSSKQVMLRVH
jgi:hypothetical protein